MVLGLVAIIGTTVILIWPYLICRKKSSWIFMDLIEELETLYEFDIVFIKPVTDRKLLENILREGKGLMKHPAELENLKKTVGLLREGIEKC